MTIDGREIASRKLKNLKNKIQSMETKPKLVAVLVGQDRASQTYVTLKKKRALEVGIESEIISLTEGVSREELLKTITRLNTDPSVTGILLQLPLPKHLEADQQEFLDAVLPAKDVDGLGRGKLFLPATVRAVLDLLATVGVDLSSSTMTIVGQGELVGYPLGEAVRNQVAKLNLCDHATSREELIALTKAADILVVATGQAGLVTKDMVKKGAVVIDCGAPQAEVDFGEVSKIASFITPVPGGVGPMTVVSLLENTLEAATM